MRKEKDPNEKLDYGVDWSKRLADGESIATSQWLDPSPVTDPLLVLSDESETATKTLVWIAGGVAGELYSITNRITTDSTPARIMDFTIQIKILDK